MNQNLAVTPIEEYRPTEAALVELRSRFDAVVFDVSTKKGMEEAKKGRAELRDLRVSLEKTRKAIKEPALRRCQDIDSEARRITTALSALEDPIDAQIKAEEQRKEDERRAAEQRERERVEGIRSRIAAFNDEVGKVVGQPSAVIRAKLDRLRSVQVTAEVFAEFLEDAQAAHDAAARAVSDHLERQLAHEAEQVKIAQERAELERLRAEAAERERAEAERRAEQEREAQARREQEERELQERREREEAELRAERERAHHNDAAIRSIRDQALEFVSAPSNMIHDEITRLETDPELLAHVDEEYRAQAQEAVDATVAKLRELAAASAERERHADELRQQRERQEAERRAEEQRQAEERERLEAERARLEAEMLAQVTLHDAAQSALDWLIAHGHGQQQVARMLSAALSRDVAEAA